MQFAPGLNTIVTLGLVPRASDRADFKLTAAFTWARHKAGHDGFYGTTIQFYFNVL